MNQAYTSKILTRLQPALKAEGFRKRSAHFTRESADVKQTISLQKSTRSNRHVVVAAINLCVFSKELAARLLELGEVSFPTDCHWFERLSEPSPPAPRPNSTKWWTVRSDGEADETADEMTNLLIRYGVPALDEVFSTGKLLKFWSSGKCQGITEAARSKYVAVLTDQAKNETAARHEKLAALYKAVTLQPGDAESRLQLGIALRENLQYDEATAHLEEAARMDDENAQIHFHLGKAYGLSLSRRAIVEFSRSLAIEPGNPDAHFELAASLANVADTEGAIREYQEALRLDPLHRYAHDGLVNSLLVVGRVAEASAKHREFMEKNGDR